jgi:hypothetical protein
MFTPNAILRKKVISLIKRLGLGTRELIIDIEIEDITINTIEYDVLTGKLLIHVFVDEFDIIYDFDSIEKEYKLKIIDYLYEI